MNTAVKTTIMLPEDELVKVKTATVQENNKDPMRLAGIFKLGIKKGETFRRKDMYDDYLKRKMDI